MYPRSRLTVRFALFLSPEGVALAHRQRAGHWAFLGETRVDVDDLPAALRDLRARAAARADEDVRAVLILPDDQILYTSFTAPADDAARTVARIEDGLNGLTPYPVAELRYDHRAVEADRVKVAVVARETLDEARDFARRHGFEAAGFAARPPARRFPGVPVFDADDAFGFDATDAPGGAAEEEDIAGLGFDGEVFVDGADECAFGFFEDAEVAGFGDDAAVEDGGEFGGASRSEGAVDAVAVDEWS